MTEQEQREYVALMLCNQSFILCSLALLVTKPLSEQLMEQSFKTIKICENRFKDLMKEKVK